MRKIVLSFAVLVLAGASLFATSAVAGASCADLPDAAELRTHFMAVTATGDNGGRGHFGWLTLMDSAGVVCAVVHAAPDGIDVTTDMSGTGHREQSARKANTANAFSNVDLALASGNLFVQSMPGYQLFGTTLADLSSEEINGSPADSTLWGTTNDPMIGKAVGGYLAVAGGLALYNTDKKKVGALGVSGDTYCTSHVVAWKVRELLEGPGTSVPGRYSVANVPGGISGTDALLQDLDPTKGPGEAGYSASGFGFVCCADNPTAVQSGDSIVDAGNQCRAAP